MLEGCAELGYGIQFRSKENLITRPRVSQARVKIIYSNQSKNRGKGGGGGGQLKLKHEGGAD